MMRFIHRPGLLVALATGAVIASAVGLAAADAGTPASGADTEQQRGALSRIWNWSDARVRGIFEEILPDTQERRSWRVSLHPRFRDLVDKDHLRIPLEVTYGFNRRAEGEIEIDGYVTNPFERDSAGGNGISNLRGAFKYQWRPSLDPSVRAASGLQVIRPIPNSPDTLNQGANRYGIYSTFARVNPANPNMEGFLNLSYDMLTPSSAGGHIREDEPQDDFVRVGTGVLLRSGALTYGLRLSVARTVDGESRTFTSVTPSVIYDIPHKYTFNGPGRWQIGAALESQRYGSESDLNLRIRVRWFVDLRRAYHDWRNGNGAAGHGDEGGHGPEGARP